MNRTDEILKNCKNLHVFERIFIFDVTKNPEPVREHVPFQSRLAQVFSDLDESQGEEEDNNFWVRRVGDEPTEEKLVLRVEAPARGVVRFLHALLADSDTPFVGAKLYVGIDDVLCVAYVRPGAEVTELLLCDLCEACGSSPLAAVSPERGEAASRLVWPIRRGVLAVPPLVLRGRRCGKGCRI